MSSTCFESEGSSSGRQLYVQLWYGNVPYRGFKTCRRHQKLKIKILIYKMCISLAYTV